MKNIRKVAMIAGVLALLIAPASFGQSVTGNVFGTISSADGEILPGVTVTLETSPSKTQVTNAQGQYRFLGIDPGSYPLKANLDGFGSVEYPSVNVSIGRNPTINLQLAGHPLLLGEPLSGPPQD